jgi:hypothetical protein
VRLDANLGVTWDRLIDGRLARAEPVVPDTAEMVVGTVSTEPVQYIVPGRYGV